MHKVAWFSGIGVVDTLTEADNCVCTDISEK